jgi:pSer/pThr/pTyr-binding forkhead associated (FHA) protein
VDVSSSRAAGQLIGQVPPTRGGRVTVTGTLIFDDGRRVPLFQSGYSLGRGPANDLRFDAGDMSTRHAQLSYDGTDWWISDLNSKNGVRVNAQPIRDQKLAHGDSIQLAHTVSFRFEDPRARTSQRNLIALAALGGLAAIAIVWWLMTH